jgi:hypothetical protein
VVPDLDKIRIALAFAEQLAPTDRTVQARFDEVTGLVREFLDSPKEKDRVTQLETMATNGKKEASAVGVACLLASACGSLTRLKPVFMATSAAIGRSIQLMTQAGTSTRQLIEDLDRRLVVAESAAAFRQHAKPGPPGEVQAVLWRAARGPTQPEAGHWIARFADGNLGLLSKKRRGWLTVYGDRETVLASVPESLFQDAVEAVSQG